MNISEVSEEIMLTAEDIRYARNIDLAAVTEIDPSNFAAWSNSRGISERNLKRTVCSAKSHQPKKNPATTGLENNSPIS